MNVGKIVGSIIDEKGMTQTAVTRNMIKLMPELRGRFTTKKMSAIIKGRRKMTCDELIAFCIVMNVDPSAFMVAA